MGAQGPAVILDWNKTSLWSPQSIGHRHPTVQQCPTIISPSLGVDELTEALAHHARDAFLWGAPAIQRFYHSATYRLLCQLQLRLPHLLFLVSLVLISSIFTEVFRFALRRGVWGHPSRRHAPRFGTAGVYRGTTRGISWCRIRPRNLRQLQRDPTITTARALSTGHRAYFADDEQLERFADSLCWAHAAGLPMGLCRWVSNPFQGRYQSTMLLAVIAFFTRLTWFPLVSFYLPLTPPKLLSVWHQGSQWLDQLQLPTHYPLTSWVAAHLCPGLPGLPLPPTVTLFWIVISALSLLLPPLSRLLTRDLCPSTIPPTWTGTLQHHANRFPGARAIHLVLASIQWVLALGPVWALVAWYRTTADLYATLTGIPLLVPSRIGGLILGLAIAHQALGFIAAGWYHQALGAHQLWVPDPRPVRLWFRPQAHSPASRGPQRYIDIHLDDREFQELHLLRERHQQAILDRDPARHAEGLERFQQELLILLAGRHGALYHLCSTHRSFARRVAGALWSLVLRAHYAQTQLQRLAPEGQVWGPKGWILAALGYPTRLMPLPSLGRCTEVPQLAHSDTSVHLQLRMQPILLSQRVTWEELISQVVAETWSGVYHFLVTVLCPTQWGPYPAISIACYDPSAPSSCCSPPYSCYQGRSLRIPLHLHPATTTPLLQGTLTPPTSDLPLPALLYGAGSRLPYSFEWVKGSST